MRILVLEPWDRGSHRLMLDQWTARSRHEFTRMGLAGRHWKWRMRHAPLTFARQLQAPEFAAQTWDVIFTSDMLNLAEFRGLAPPSVRVLPAISYFHENQFTYPDRFRQERDLHFAYSNFVTAAAADQVWFNSAYHRDALLDAMESFLRRMPDHQEVDAPALIRARSQVMHPGIDVQDTRAAQSADGPLRIAWVARWEHDKGPEIFFDACRALRQRGTDIRLIMLGEHFSEVPDAFTRARSDLAAQVEHWGFAPDRRTYLQLLASAHVVVSTAHHEFFGIAVLEAAAVGCRPVVPRALAYPETLGDLAIFHDNTPRSVAAAIEAAARAREDVSHPILTRFAWTARVDAFDDAIERAARGATRP
ncbi:MAG: DUF3524 domain-containing protein [Phycisphaerales bacterium]|nr:DUF3524 domain-containing protein [Phycisphaerales bacterium]